MDPSWTYVAGDYEKGAFAEFSFRPVRAPCDGLDRVRHSDGTLFMQDTCIAGGGCKWQSFDQLPDCESDDWKGLQGDDGETFRLYNGQSEKGEMCYVGDAGLRRFAMATTDFHQDLYTFVGQINF